MLLGMSGFIFTTPAVADTWSEVASGGFASDYQFGQQVVTSSRDGPTVVLAPHSRKTFNVAETVGQVWEVSTKVSSDKPVIAERAMYGNGRVWGTDSIGCPW